MPYTHNFAWDVQALAGSFRKSSAYSGSIAAVLDETIPANASTTFSNFDVDVSAMASLFMLCDRDITVKVNDDGSPDATINLLANVPLVWTNDGYFTNPMGSVDATSIKATLAAGDDARLIIEAPQDAIP